MLQNNWIASIISFMVGLLAYLKLNVSEELSSTGKGLDLEICFYFK